MDVFLKAIAFVLLGTGAFLVYGAKLAAGFYGKRNDDGGRTGNDEKLITYPDEKSDADMQQNNPENTDDIYKPVDKKVLNIKMAGMLLVIAGGILAIAAYR